MPSDLGSTVSVRNALFPVAGALQRDGMCRDGKVFRKTLFIEGQEKDRRHMLFDPCSDTDPVTAFHSNCSDTWKRRSQIFRVSFVSSLTT